MKDKGLREYLGVEDYVEDSAYGKGYLFTLETNILDLQKRVVELQSEKLKNYATNDYVSKLSEELDLPKGWIPDCDDIEKWLNGVILVCTILKKLCNKE